MAWQTTLASPLFVLSAGVSAALALSFLHRRDRPGAQELSWLFFGLAGWATMSLGELSSVGVEQKLLFARISYGFVGTTCIAWFVFATAYTDQWAFRSWMWAALGTVPAVVVAAAWTSPASGLLWTAATTESVNGVSYIATEKGPVFYLFIVFSYSLVVLGSVFLGRLAVVSRREYRGQSLLLLSGLAATWLTNVSHFLGLLPVRFDPTPLAFTVSGGLFALATVEFDLFDVLPAAREAVRDHVIDDLRDGVVVVAEGSISDLNPAAERMLGPTAGGIGGEPLAAVAPELAANLEAGERTFEYTPEDSEAIYDVRVSSFTSMTGRVEGEVLTLRDVTERRQREQRLSVMNRVLRHDIRNDLNVVSGYASLVADDGEDEVDRRAAAETIVQRVDSMTELADKVRSVERALDSEMRPREPFDLGPRLRETVADAERDAPDATIEYVGPDVVPVEAIPLVGIAFDNLVENAVRHGGDSPTIEVRVELGDETVVTVSDDGPGIPDHELEAIRGDGETPLQHASGFGLWLVQWFVTHSGGHLSLSTGESGTVSRVTLPRGSSDAVERTDGTGETNATDDAP